MLATKKFVLRAILLDPALVHENHPVGDPLGDAHLRSDDHTAGPWYHP